jgi:ABC-type antimicrobial peptide transport system permease subunit
VISYMVARRSNEIGIRMALGASGAGILRLILREALLLLGIGLAIGAGLALAAARTAPSMLFGLKPYDPPTLLFAISMLAWVAIAASYIPARRAAKVDPMVPCAKNKCLLPVPTDIRLCFRPRRLQAMKLLA